MRKEPNKRMIGIFMVSGIAVLMATFLVFINEKFFSTDGKLVVMYFEESINGLNEGAPVVFKGVKIGKVVSIDLIANSDNLTFSIPVYVRMEPRKNIRGSEFDTRVKVLDELINKGLRARLTMQSFLTGLLMIELEMLPGTPVNLYHDKDGDILEIPTVLSPIGELSKGIQDLPIAKSVEEFNKFFSGLNNKMPNILSQLNGMLSRLNSAVSSKSGSSADTIANFNKTLTSVGEAARSLRNLTDYLERHPESLLKGKK